MRPQRIMSVLVILFLAPFFIVDQVHAHPHLLDVESKKEIPYQEMIGRLAESQVIFVGESHDHAGHHRMQLNIIRSLAETGKPIAIGLEMFQIDDQPALDDWVAGAMDVTDFAGVFNRNWSMWPLYSEIFEFARQHGIPLIALNISRDIIRQVAREGFNSLEPRQLQGLEGVTCAVDPAYENFIRRALGDHGHSPVSFRFFCEAQMLWDTAMAKHLNDFLILNPEFSVVVLAGSGHSWKYGIPNQLRQLGERPYYVVLPEVYGRIDRNHASAQDTDFLWLDVGPQSWEID